MEKKEKDYIKLRFGLALQNILANNKVKADDSAKGHRLITSLRKLEAASGIDYKNIQRISTGEVNVELTTVYSLAEGLDMSLGEFFSYFDRITEKEVEKHLQDRKKEASKKSVKKQVKKRS